MVMTDDTCSDCGAALKWRHFGFLCGRCARAYKLTVFPWYGRKTQPKHIGRVFPESQPVKGQKARFDK
jgi:hypothetical protein